MNFHKMIKLKRKTVFPWKWWVSFFFFFSLSSDTFIWFEWHCGTLCINWVLKHFFFQIHITKPDAIIRNLFIIITKQQTFSFHCFFHLFKLERIKIHIFQNDVVKLHEARVFQSIQPKRWTIQFTWQRRECKFIWNWLYANMNIPMYSMGMNEHFNE